jgi:uncharacterized membrane protein
MLLSACEILLMGLIALVSGTAYLLAVSYSIKYAVQEKIPAKALLYALLGTGILGPTLASETGASTMRFTVGVFAAMIIAGICTMRWLGANRKISQFSEFDTPADVSGRAALVKERQLLSQPAARKATLLLAILATAVLVACIFI